MANETKKKKPRLNKSKSVSIKAIKKILLKKDKNDATVHNINGYNVLLVNIPNSDLIHIQSYVNVGFLEETEKNCGISHLLEHVLVNSWDQCNKHACLEVLSKKGIQCNARTSLTTTNYHTTSTTETFNEMLEYISTITTSAKITQRNINLEVNAVFNELKDHSNSPKNKLWDLIHRELYCSDGGKYSYDSELQIKNLKRLDVRTLTDYYNEHYVPEKTTFVICGDINKKEVIRSFEKIVGPSKCKYASTRTFIPCFKNLNENKYIFHKRKDSETAFCTFTYVPINYCDYLLLQFSLTCLNHVLFHALRYKNKYVYYLNCGVSRSHCGPQISIVYETSENKIKASHDVIVNIIEKYKKSFFSNTVISSRKKHATIDFEKANQNNPQFMASHYIAQFVYETGEIYSPKRLYKKSLIITKRQIKDTINKSFDNYIFGYQSVNKIF